MKQIKKSVSLFLDEQILLAVRQEAEVEKRSLSRQINYILRGYFAQEREISIPEEQPENHTCKSCDRFQQHYVKTMYGWYTAVNCGHCVAARIKNRKPGAAACGNWNEKLE